MDAHMKETNLNTVSTIDTRKKRKKRKGGHKFQQFETEETEKAEEERGSIHRRKRDAYGIADYVCSGQGRFESTVDRRRRRGKWFTSTLYSRVRASQQFQ
jgi:hypothetical protein